MHEKFALRQSQMQFARLMDLCDKQQAALADDPKPFLDAAAQEVTRARKVFDDVSAALCGLHELFVNHDPRIFESPTAAMYRRHQHALDILHRFRYNITSNPRSEPK